MPLRPQPLIAVRSVEVSSRFCQRLLGCEDDRGGREYGRLMFDREFVLAGPPGDIEVAGGHV